MVREQAGHATEPTACVIDTQSVKTATSVPTGTQGTDASEKIVGRKRSITVETLGLLLLVMVTAASVSDNEAGKQLLIRTQCLVCPTSGVKAPWHHNPDNCPDGKLHYDAA